MKILSRLSFIVVLSLLIISSSVFAAVTTTSTAPEKKVIEVTPVVLATVNINDAKIVSQEGNTFKISFSLTNREGLQTGVKYSVKLIKDGQYMTDEKVYDESLTLNPNSEIKKEIEYIAPQAISGKYSLLLVSNNTKGFPFAITNLGDVVLRSSTTGLQILSETCYIQVVSEKNNPKYYLLQGVDIKPEENLKLTCSVFNSAKTDISAVPTYETRYRSTYGEIVPQTGGDETPINFKAGEKKEASFILPKATAPQSYNVDLTLVSGSTKSNSISTHYVLRGASASIQNLSLDKDYYKGGEEAKVSFIYTPSADSFERSRFGKTELASVSSTLVMTNGKGKSCAKTETIDLTKPTSIKIDAPVKITSSCYDPKITVTVTDDKGTVLGQSEFDVKTTSVPEPKSNILYFVISLILIALIILFMILKKKNILPGSTTGEGSPVASVPMGILFMFIFLSAFGVISVKNVSADTVSVGSGRYAVVNIDKNNYYYPNENVTGTAALYDTVSGQQTSGTIEISVPDASAERASLYSRSISGSLTPPLSYVGLPIPSSAGTHNAKFYISAYINTTSTTVPDNYTACMSNCNLVPTNTYYYQLNADGSYSPWYAPGGPIVNYKFIKTPGYSYNTDNYATATYSIPFTVVVPPAPVLPTVTVRVNDKPSDSFVGGGPARITWDSLNATKCNCTFSPAVNGNTSCGSGIGKDQGGNTYTVSETTTFSVTCSDIPSSLPTTPGTQYWFKLHSCQDASNYETGPYSDYRYSTGDLLAGALDNGTYNYRVTGSATSSYGYNNIGVSRASVITCPN